MRLSFTHRGGRVFWFGGYRESGSIVWCDPNWCDPISGQKVHAARQFDYSEPELDAAIELQAKEDSKWGTDIAISCVKHD